MGQATSTLVIELVIVCMTVAVGAVVMADVWPSPDVPLIWMGAAAGVFLVYAVVTAVRDMRAMIRAQRGDEARAGADASASASAGEPLDEVPVESLDEVPVESVDAPSGPTPTLALGAPSEEATAFLSLEELRPETEEDNTTSKVPSVPLFAESSMYSTAELAAGARQLGDEQSDDQPLGDEPMGDNQKDAAAHDSGEPQEDA